MRRIAWVLLLLFVFVIPWEYSLDLGAPLGNVARIAGLVLLAAYIPALLQAGSLRRPDGFHLAAMVWLLWLGASVFWSIDARSTAAHLPGYFEEVMVAWFLWELVESDRDMRVVVWAYAAGVAVLALLTISNFALPQSPQQVRFVPEGQDPNDVARFLTMGVPFSAWLAFTAERRLERVGGWLVLLLAPAAVLLTASRGGFLACGLSLMGCALIAWPRRGRQIGLGLIAVPAAMVVLWSATPRAILLRLATIPDQLMSGDLNRRWDIWSAGLAAFGRAPWVGWGAGSFVAATRLAPIDTAHNSALAIAVEGGMVSLAIAGAVLAFALRALRFCAGPLRIALGVALGAWLFLSLVSDVHESRTTWLLLGIVVAAGRLGWQGETDDAAARIMPRAVGGATGRPEIGEGAVL